MQMIIFLLEQHIRYYEQQEGTNQIHPVAEYIIRAHIDEAQRHHQLHCHIQQAHLHVTYLQFIRHQLIGMFTMRLAQVLMQHDTVANGQNTIHAIHQKENQIRQVASRDDYLTNQKQHDERNTD